MKKILFFSHVGTLGGSGLSLINIIKSIDPSIYDLTIANIETPDTLINAIRELDICKVVGIKSRTVSFYYSNGGKPILFSPLFFNNLIRVLKCKKEIKQLIIGNKPDVIMINSMTMFYIGKIAKKLGKKTICWQRETFPDFKYSIRKAYIMKCMSTYFDVITFISQYDMCKFRNRIVNKQLIYDRINFDSYTRLIDDREKIRIEFSLDSNCKYVLFLGGMSKLKGTHLALEALTHINSDSIKLLIIGYPLMYIKKRLSDCIGIKSKLRYILNMDYEAYCLKYINRNYLHDKIVFLPHIKEVEKYIIASDILIFPSTEAHQARPIYEAVAAQKPIVISEYPNTKEFITNNTIEFYPNNSIDLAKKIEETLKSRTYAKPNEYSLIFNQHDVSTLKTDLDMLLNTL